MSIGMENQCENCEVDEVTNDDGCEKMVEIIIQSSPYGPMFNNSQFSDIIFSLNNGNKITAHKLVVVVHSEVLKTMLEIGMEETHSKEIEINEDDYTVFETMIKYMYTGEVNCEEDILLPLILMSDKYEVKNLRNACLEYCQRQLNEKNCFDYYMVANSVQNGNNTLKETTSSFIAMNFERVSKNELFQVLDIDCLREFFSREDLCITSESNVLKAIINWTKYDIEIRKNYIVQLINDFIILDDVETEELQKIFDTDDMLNLRDNNVFLQMLVSSLFFKLNCELDSSKTKDKDFTRRISSGKLRSISTSFCVTRGTYDILATSYKWNNTGSASVIDLIASETVGIAGIGLFVGIGSYSGIVEIEDFVTKKILGNKKYEIISTKYSLERVSFSNLVKIQKEARVSIKLCHLGPQSGSMNNGLSKVVVQGIEFNFLGNPASVNSTDVSRGQIPCIYVRKLTKN